MGLLTFHEIVRGIAAFLAIRFLFLGTKESDILFSVIINYYARLV